MRPLFLLFACLPLAVAAFMSLKAAEPELDWSDLMSATTREVGDKTVIDFKPSLLPLNGQMVTIRGWITPINLGDGTTVSEFLLTGTPGTCPFCLGVGPEGFVLISAAKPVPADITVELLLRGRFVMSQDDPTGFYYRIRDAQVIGHQ
jgi:hypothetical protein